MIQPAATGISESPITVMIEPVTTGGKKRMICEKNGEIARPISAATITAPSTLRRPPVPSSPMIESIVATDANEIPCTSGSWEPKYGSPSVCSSVAAPLTKSAQASSVPICGPVRPAALPTMIGTAITPPNIERMCWTP